MVETRGKVIKVFFCYAPEDRVLSSQLEIHLSPMRRLKQITGWFARDILAGNDWASEIETQINEASLILLLISPDFIHSDFCYSVEMQRALEKHKNGTAHVIPIIIRPVLWEDIPFSKLQMLPTDAKPITSWPNRDEALLDVVRGISKVVKMLLSKETLSQQETSLLEQLGRTQSITLPQKPQLLDRTSQPSKITLPPLQRDGLLRRIFQAQFGQPKSSTLSKAQLNDPMTGRILNRRYLLQGLIQHGQVCAIYQGTDQVLQRTVAIKAIPAPDMATYRAAIKLTGHFSHPNIVGTYDIVLEPEMLYIVQEYIEGANFSTLLQTQLAPYEVVDFGIQVCRAVIYADNASPKVCHGDLTPTAILCDHHGFIHINNFALPSNFHYFQSWCKIGGDGIALSDTELPYGQQSEGRRSDDTRAVGLLLYQLLAGRSPGASVVEPPDGRLRFQGNVPAELCELVARAIFRTHPKCINSAELLFSDLEMLAEEFEVQQSK